MDIDMQIFNLFYNLDHYAMHKFNECDFEKASKVHDWKNHVPEELIPVWNDLTERERKIIFIMAESSATAEIWPDR